LNINGDFTVEGGSVNLDLSNFEIGKGKAKDIPILTADKIKGKFDQVAAEVCKDTVKYKEGQLLASIKAGLLLFWFLHIKKAEGSVYPFSSSRFIGTPMEWFLFHHVLSCIYFSF